MSGTLVGRSIASDQEGLSLALELAREAENLGEVPVGALVAQDGKVIGAGFNLRERDQDPLAHAELKAIAEAARTLTSWRLERAVLYVTLEPCPMCLGAIAQSRVERVVYGAADPKGGALSLGYALHADTRTNHRFEVELQTSPECSQILSRFFKKLR